MRVFIIFFALLAVFCVNTFCKARTRYRSSLEISTNLSMYCYNVTIGSLTVKQGKYRSMKATAAVKNLQKLWLRPKEARKLKKHGCGEAAELFVNLYRLSAWMKKVKAGKNCAAKNRPLPKQFVKNNCSVEAPGLSNACKSDIENTIEVLMKSLVKELPTDLETMLKKNTIRLPKCIQKIRKKWLLRQHKAKRSSSCAFLTDDVITKLRHPCA